MDSTTPVVATTTPVPAVDPTKPTLEEKILQATQEADQIVAAFSPQAAELINMGVAVEPIMHGFVSMFVALFKHHTSQAVVPPAQPATTGV